MKKILVIDDEKTIRQGLSAFVQSLGSYDMIGCCRDGKEALSVLEQSRPDIVITDICMPAMDGLAFVEKCRSLSIRPKIIIISGYANFEYARAALRLEVYDYLLKPVNHGQLIAVLDKASGAIDEECKEQRLRADLTGRGVETSEQENQKQYGHLVEGALKHIHMHYSEDLNLHDIQEHFYINISYFCKLFKTKTGTTFNQYVTDFRIARAKELLKHEHYKIYEIAGMVGYKNPKYFFKVFKEQTGKTPKEYQEMD